MYVQLVLLRVDRRSSILLTLVVLLPGSTTRMMRPSNAMLSSRALLLGAREVLHCCEHLDSIDLVTD